MDKVFFPEDYDDYMQRMESGNLPTVESIAVHLAQQADRWGLFMLYYLTARQSTIVCDRLKDYLPTVSSIVICLIVAGVIGANKQAILTSSVVIIIVIILQYFLAMLLGFGVGYLAGMGKKQIVTVAIELAFQNSGLSTSLAKTHFPDLSQATVPGALYSVWQNFAGSILAYVFRKYV